MSARLELEQRIEAWREIRDSFARLLELERVDPCKLVALAVIQANFREAEVILEELERALRYVDGTF